VAGAVLGLPVGWVILNAVLPSGLPLGVVLQGVVLGSLIGLSALGLVLVYRSSRVVNFAQASMGTAAAAFAVQLFQTKGWNYYLALVAGLVVAALVGVLCDRVVVQRLFWAPRLILTVATIGLAQILSGAQLAVPKLMGGSAGFGGLTTGFRTPLHLQFTFGGLVFNGAHVMVLITVPVVLALFAVFLRRSSLGVGIRATSSNAERAMLLGVPVRRLSMLVWALAGVLSALAAMLSAPLVGSGGDLTAGPTLLLPALAAAVIARMESLPAAVLAGVGVGVFQQAVFWNTSRSSYVDVGLLIAVLLALLVQRHSLSRVQDANTGGWAAAEESPPVPAALARLPEIIWGRRLLFLAIAFALVMLPYALSPSQISLIGTVTIIYGLVAVSLVVLTGWAGQISLGQFAIAGVGAVVTGDLVAKQGTDLVLAMIAGSAAGALIALAVGIPALRIRGLFLGVTTLAFAVPLSTFFLNPANFPSLIPTQVDRPRLFDRWNLTDERTLYWFALATLGVALGLVTGIRRARPGRAMVAVRDNERAAAARGLSPTGAKLAAFAVSGALAGLAGALHVITLNGVRAGAYTPNMAFEAFSMVVLGGATSLPGALAGATFLRLAEYYLTGSMQLVVTGAGVLLVLLILPGGLGRVLDAGRGLWFRFVARLRHIELAGPGGRLAAAEVDLAGIGDRLATPDDAAPARPRMELVRPRPDQDDVVPTVVGDRAVLECRNLEVSYGRNKVLHGVSLHVEPGEVLALLGTNGAGKSTVLRAISGLTPPRRGSVLLGGTDLTGSTPMRMARAGLAYMPGGRGIFPDLSVGENLRMATWVGRRSPEHTARCVAHAVELFPALAGRMADRAGLLSGGQQQMLALAQALVQGPPGEDGRPGTRVLLIDELSLGLAPVVVAELLDVVRRLRESGLAIVLVEQSAELALQVSDRAMFLEKGEMRFSGPAQDILQRGDLIRSVFLAGVAGGEDTVPDPVPTPVSIGLRTDVDLAVATGAQAHDRIAIAARGLRKNFGGLAAIDGVDLDVRPGEIVGLMGPNGAGKTTILDALSGFLAPDSGRVFFAGHDVTAMPPQARAHLGLGRSFQDARLFPGLTVAETIAVSCERWVTSREPLAAALRLPTSLLSEAAIAERVERIIALLGLGVFRDRFATQLSTGSRRLVEFGCLLAQEPDVLLLDEPAAGLARAEAELMGPLLKRIREATGSALVIVEHDVGLLRRTCDRIVALESGRVVAQGSAEAVLSDPAVIAGYLGTPAAVAG
jgi:ABC-type branched-subunit amino acid transport system ATPase component/ABC-type branched-subunit amino acid transport system permease subunit